MKSSLVQLIGRLGSFDPGDDADALSADAGINWTAVSWCAGGIFILAALLVAYAYVPGWWRRRKLRRGVAYGRGDTAINALTVRSRAEAERDVLSRRCACKAKLAGPLPESAWSTVALGDATVTVVRAPCPCGVGLRRYYVVPGA